MRSNQLKDKISVWLATGLGLGLVSPAPGTVGGLWGLPLVWGVDCLPNMATQVLALVVVGGLGVWLCGRAAAALGGSTDPPAIVFDEIAALPLVYLGLGEKNLALWLLGWLGFRFFDIAKPWPIRHFEGLPRGWGIMADDWIAAAYAWALLRGLLWLDGLWGLGVMS